jgi:predicted MFS family arabinose efflux permease
MKSALASRVYWHEIFAVLALKSLALVLIYFLFLPKSRRSRPLELTSSPPLLLKKARHHEQHRCC